MRGTDTVSAATAFTALSRYASQARRPRGVLEGLERFGRRVGRAGNRGGAAGEQQIAS